MALIDVNFFAERGDFRLEILVENFRDFIIRLNITATLCPLSGVDCTSMFLNYK